MEGASDTIAAISSAPGPGAVGIVRLDGPEAIAIAAGLVVLDGGAGIDSAGGSTRHVGNVRLSPGGVGAPAVVYVFRAPHSYTRNDLVEIHTIGAPALLSWILRLASMQGARPANPGEFTARACLNGAMSLADAENVAAVIRADTDQDFAAAQAARSGHTTREVSRVADELADLAALVEAQIDFVDEPIEFISATDLITSVARLDETLARLSGPPAARERDSALPRILLTGPPNAGKSTLFNALLGRERAITSPVAGTTRDVLAAKLVLATGEAVLIDAAGIDDADTGIAAQARDAAMRERDRADVIVDVIDGANPVIPAAEPACDAAPEPASNPAAEPASASHSGIRLAVLTKCDLLTDADERRRLERLQASGFSDLAAVGALSDRGMSALKNRLADALIRLRRSSGAAAALLNARQCEAVATARSALRRATELVQASATVADRSELLAFELREALDALGTVTGAVTPDDLLGRVFAGFCIGK
ncbi:MAG: tRNA modification GTPase MnmE [Phycisphaerae bacterium]|nr:tRNA modification GTPase MnmE [Phycisphaerae bacterium]